MFFKPKIKVNFISLAIELIEDLAVFRIKILEEKVKKLEKRIEKLENKNSISTQTKTNILCPKNLL